MRQDTKVLRQQVTVKEIAGLLPMCFEKFYNFVGKLTLRRDLADLTCESQAKLRFHEINFGASKSDGPPSKVSKAPNTWFT
jgi:hypothetical protein